MNLVLALFVVAGFATTIEYLSLPDRARAVGERSSRSLAVLRDDCLGDKEKEKVLQEESGKLFRLLGLLAGGSTLALGLPLGIVWFLGQLGVGSFWATISVLERLDFLAGVTIIGGLGYFFVRRYRQSHDR